ncbi:hypothetical protein K2173_013200 [Erythroxylum novogranatense]|uniref:Myb/SANT-like DNA-binding domain-containing protein n=1 Tax=Erythroxylum novogranatense TaxID=1862640 RepID=A0AAV8SC44_9ROSI|nr:hypothetical protein K2173_013200 [Erythroxylum novogranatense]
MDEIEVEDDARYPPKPHPLNRSRNFPSYPHPPATHYNHRDYEDDSDDPDDIHDDTNNHGVYPRISEQKQDFERYPKRQKLKSSASNYEFAPRSGRFSSQGDGNFAPDWGEHDKFVLLEVWGERFLQLGRNSLRSEDWAEVAEKVSQVSKTPRTEVQCRQMMDGLRRKYRKEKGKGFHCSKWAFFKKMDMLMKQELGVGGGVTLACGLDSGEFVFMDTRVYLEHANGNDEMRDSPCESEEETGDKDVGQRFGANEGVKGLRVLADSVQKFGEIYEKIESSKRDQMMELERMRVEFQRDLELQKKQILERAQAEIAKIREGDDENDNDEEENIDGEDDSGENISE